MELEVKKSHVVQSPYTWLNIALHETDWKFLIFLKEISYIHRICDTKFHFLELQIDFELLFKVKFDSFNLTKFKQSSFQHIHIMFYNLGAIFIKTLIVSTTAFFTPCIYFIDNLIKVKKSILMTSLLIICVFHKIVSLLSNNELNNETKLAYFIIH